MAAYGTALSDQARPSASGRALSAVRLAPFRALAWTAAVLGADIALNPTHNHVPLCPLHALTGLNCPFCGSLRAASLVVRGRFQAAMHDNLLFVSALPVLLVFWIDWLIRTRTGQTHRPVPRAAVIAATVLAIVFAAVRNLPFGRALSP